MKYLSFLALALLFTGCSSSKKLSDEVVYKQYVLNDTIKAKSSLLYENLAFDKQSNAILNAKNDFNSVMLYGIKKDYVKSINTDLRNKGFILDNSSNAEYILTVDIGQNSYSFGCDSVEAISEVVYTIKDNTDRLIFKKEYQSLFSGENKLSLSHMVDTTLLHAFKSNNRNFIKDVSTLTSVEVEEDSSVFSNDFKAKKNYPFLMKIHGGGGFSNYDVHWLPLGAELFVSRKTSIVWGANMFTYRYEYDEPLVIDNWYEKVTYTEETYDLDYFNLGLRHYFNNCQKGIFIEGGINFGEDLDYYGYYTNIGYHFRLTRYLGLQPYLFYNKLTYNGQIKAISDKYINTVYVDKEFNTGVYGVMVTLSLYIF